MPKKPPPQDLVNPDTVRAPFGGGLTIGRLVHYVLPDGRSEGQERPALIVRVWRARDEKTGKLLDPTPPFPIQLQVFFDGENDYNTSIAATIGMLWKSSVPYSEEMKPGTWHWPGGMCR